ncbi:hypothetical protein HU200_028699 [Digitaria exilis]|uniref:Caffeoyl-CoA O-methyltransferase n=1 Tax=Digitaria exilis TaxID=1010633 RepID=A0A835ESR4_9POAL|nr:hypothetical protein HU200_028699 [Digitaria exilis]CAB3482172.1 unnamed protein product [Digitaria exilis]
MSHRLAAALPLPPPPPAAVAAAARQLGFPRPLNLLSATTPTATSSASPRRRGALGCLVRLLCSAARTTPLPPAVEEARRGRKQLGMTPPLYDYLHANVREHPVLRELREETATMSGSQMQVSPAQAQLLAMLVQILGAQRCIEVGVFTGYSSLAVALALPESGRLIACERDGRCLEVAKKYYQRAGVAHKIDVRHALAVDSLRSLLDCGEASSYDFAFVDADKRMYEEYFELLLKLVRVGGLIVMDNVLWYGRVADPLVDDKKTISIRNFNKKVFEDERVDISMVPIGDGMTICRKLVDT